MLTPHQNSNIFQIIDYTLCSSNQPYALAECSYFRAFIEEISKLSPNVEEDLKKLEEILKDMDLNLDPTSKQFFLNNVRVQAELNTQELAKGSDNIFSMILKICHSQDKNCERNFAISVYPEMEVTQTVYSSVTDWVFNITGTLKAKIAASIEAINNIPGNVHLKAKDLFRGFATKKPETSHPNIEEVSCLDKFVLCRDKVQNAVEETDPTSNLDEVTVGYHSINVCQLPLFRCINKIQEKKLSEMMNGMRKTTDCMMDSYARGDYNISHCMGAAK